MYDIILITVDSLRADHVGCIGGEDTPFESLTPHLDEWSKGVVVFPFAISQSSHTSPSFLAMLSGCYPSRFGDWFSTLSEQRTTVAEVLKETGYTTCAVNSNPYISKTFGFDKGFDFFEDNVPKVRSGGLGRKIDLTLLRLKTPLIPPYQSADKLNKQTLNWLDRNLRPFFLWIHYMDVHGPYLSKTGFAVRNRLVSGSLWHKALTKPNRISNREKGELVKTYREKVKYLDSEISQLLKKIDSDNTLVILVADHGDLFGEHGLFGHPLRLYEGLLRVPLLIKLPSAMRPKVKRIERTVQSMDIAPTILDVVGARPRKDFDGCSLLPLIMLEDVPYTCEYVLSEVSRSHLAVRKPPWKLIVNYKEQTKELYNLAKDPNEHYNLAKQETKILAELECLVRSHIDRFKSPPTGFRGNEVDDEVRSQLKALGYMD